MFQVIIGTEAEFELDGADSQSKRRTLLTYHVSEGISVRLLCENAAEPVGTAPFYVDVCVGHMRHTVK
jgi:hypothetical protein